MVNQIPSNITQLRHIGETDLNTASSARAQGTVAKPMRGGTADEVALSASARQLPLEMTKGPPVDQALVAHLSSEIAAGRYPLNPDKIADALAAQVSLLAD